MLLTSTTSLMSILTVNGSPSGPSGSGTASSKRKSEDDSVSGDGGGARVKVESPRGEKRPASAGPEDSSSSDSSSSDSSSDSEMSAWLDELCRIPNETFETIMILDTGDLGKSDDIMEILSPPRVVRE